MVDRAVDEALLRARMQDRRNERWQSLSGGEKQRTHIARARCGFGGGLASA